MYRVALRMLMGDTTKYIALVFGLAFSTMLIVQQGSVFTGLMGRTAAKIDSIPQADIWVMDPATRYFDERKPIEDTAVLRVRGVPGVDWAEPVFFGMGTARMPDKTFASVLIVGVDRASRLGLADRFESGSPDAINQPDAILWDHLNLPIYQQVKVGTVMEINDRRAQVVAIASAPRTINSNPVVYTTYNRALAYAPGERKRLAYVLVKTKPGEDPQVVARRIRDVTGLGAKSRDEFFWDTVKFFLKSTGIGINFGLTVLLGFIVGVAVAGQTFYTFTVENTKNFAALKAMGLGRWTLIGMVLLQATVVGVLGWGLGVGGAAIFGLNITDRSVIAYHMTPQLMAISFAASVFTVLLAGGVSARRVLKIEPAIVFR
ncbi:MAG: FtsX-like permease family protein [Planctomycetota bacterium]|nr:FtsX-like permease family protein [Planctomycetota bacterium]